MKNENSIFLVSAAWQAIFGRRAAELGLQPWARIIVTLLESLRERNAARGIASLCAGVGEVCAIEAIS